MLQRSNSSVLHMHLKRRQGEDNGTPSQDDDTPSQSPDHGGNWFTMCFIVALIMWQSGAIREYAAPGNWPAAIWNGQHIDGLDGSCSKLFSLMRATVYVSIIALVLHILFYVLASAPGLWSCGSSLAAGLIVVESMVPFAKFVLLIYGLLTLVQVGGNTTGACPNMYNVAWWTYLGFFLVFVILSLVCCCCCGGILSGILIATGGGEDPIPNENKTVISHEENGTYGTLEENKPQATPASESPA